MATRSIRPLAALAAAAALGAAGTQVFAQSGEAPEVKRVALAESTKVRGAPDRTLGLSRVTIPAGAQVALHHHLGTQIAHIQKGVLTYTVEEGQVKVMTGPADSAELVRKIEAGQTGKISAGQWIVEQQPTIHRATNKGKQKIVIYLATLLKTGAPPSTPVN